MITIKKNQNIKLDIPQFSCDDNVVGDHLNSHPLLKLLNCYGFLAIIGRPQQGKTSLAISLITQKKPKIYRKTHNHILVLMPTNSIQSLKKNPFKVLPEENLYDELNEETINDIYNRIDAYSKDGEKTLLLIDDMTADLKKSKVVETILKRIVYNRRHLKCNIILTAQSYVNIPLDIRKCITSCIMFRPPKKEMEILFNELIESKKEMFIEIMKTVFDDKHNFLFVNIPTQLMFKNFDSLVFKNDD
jgi:GTPase SAR1 family protein